MKRFVMLAVFALSPLFMLKDASAETKLFKEFEYQTPSSTFKETAGYYDCTKDFGVPARCKEDVKFLDENFGLALKFTGDKLETVVLVAKFETNLYTKIFGAISQSFQLIAMRDKTNFFDILEMRNQVTDTRKFADMVTNFETTAINQGKLSYYFIEENPQALAKFKSAIQAEREAGLNTRTVEMILYEDDEDELMVLEFSLPRRLMKTMQENIKKVKKEKF